MNNLVEREQLRGWGRRACLAVTLGLSLGALSACEGLLEVDLPAQLSDAALENPSGAETVVNSVISQFENGYNEFVWELHGREDGGEILLQSPGVDNPFVYGPTNDTNWFQPFMTARRFASDLHEKLENEWTVEQVPERAEYLAITSLYGGAVLSLMGSTLCEAAVDGGPFMTPQETYALADEWLTRALDEISSAGDFALPHDISSSAATMAYGLRARLRWMAGDDRALADAQRVPQGFTAWVTRDAGPARRNKAANDGPIIRYARLFEVNDWWEGPPNPVTGQAWPSLIPFTGYRNLGILPDGRAVRDDGLPIRTAGPYRTAVEDDAVPDPRVPYIQAQIQGSALTTYIHNRYRAEDDDIPLVNWKEMWLIRAEIEGGQTAIDLVNELRAADGLPLVTYADPGDAEEIRYLIIEERRRALFLEGRFYYTKLQNPDLLWFPRGVGNTPGYGQQLEGGVRFIMPDNEYILNSNLTLADRATGCDPDVAPVLP